MIGFVWIVTSIGILLALYGLQRLALYLEQRGLMYYWHTKPSGGGGYNPLHEMVRPNYRHVVEVGEQQQADDEGDPPVPGAQTNSSF